MGMGGGGEEGGRERERGLGGKGGGGHPRTRAPPGLSSPPGHGEAGGREAHGEASLPPTSLPAAGKWA